MENNEKQNKLDELIHKSEDLLQKKNFLSTDFYTKGLEEIVKSLCEHQSGFDIHKEESAKDLKKKTDTSNNHFHILFNHAPLGYCLMDVSGIILQANKAFKDLFDLNNNSCKGEKLHTFIQPESRKDFDHHLQAVKKNNRHNVLIIFEGPRGPFYTKLQSRITSIDGALTRKVILCIFTDVSEEVFYYKKLQQSEKRFRSLVNAMNDVIFTIDHNLKQTGLYGNWANHKNKSPEDFPGKTAGEVMGEKRGAFHEHYFREALKGKNITYDWSHESPKGRKYFQVSLSPIYDKNNTVTEIVGVGRDITLTKNNNFELQERVKEQKCLYEISKTLQNTHRPISSILQKTAGLIPAGFQYPDSAMAKIRFHKKEYSSDETIDICSPSIESQVLMEDGESIEIFVCYKTNNEEEPKPGFLKEEQHLLDAITENLGQAVEHIKARKELNRKNKMLKKYNAEKDRLFSVIAHDLRSPLSSIIGLTSLMEEKFETISKGSLKQMIKALNKSTNSLFNLLENLLEWSRIQRGQNQLKLMPHQASEIIREAINTQNNSLLQKNISITTEVPENLTINADKTSVLSVFNNLLTNAIKFTPRGGSISISARFLNKKSKAEFAICDTGIGMKQEMQENLFKMDADVKRPGTEDEPSSGLGLLISKEFVEMNGGKIKVKSKEYKGTCFYFTLPVKE